MLGLVLRRRWIEFVRIVVCDVTCRYIWVASSCMHLMMPGWDRHVVATADYSWYNPYQLP